MERVQVDLKEKRRNLLDSLSTCAAGGRGGGGAGGGGEDFDGKQMHLLEIGHRCIKTGEKRKIKGKKKPLTDDAQTTH